MIFICDITVGRLARYLRLLGFDTLYCPVPDIQHLQKYYSSSPPLLLTRKKKLHSYKPVRVLKNNSPLDQLKELHDLLITNFNENDLLTRCLKCNCTLKKVSREDIEGHIPEYVFHHQSTFYLCPVCNKIYWNGSHAINMRAFIDSVKQITFLGSNNRQR